MMLIMVQQSRRNEEPNAIRMLKKQNAPRAKRLTTCEVNARVSSLDP
jgi:hypothetical protein